MYKRKITWGWCWLSLALLPACTSVRGSKALAVPPYVPRSLALHQAIAQMDSIFFEAYNTCKPAVMESLIADDIEFYHDQGGLTTSKKELIEALKQNVCGKVTRQLLKGSVEVYPIPGYGAVQMGAHRFYNRQQQNGGPALFSKFVHTWRKENGQWKLARVISLH